MRNHRLGFTEIRQEEEMNYELRGTNGKMHTKTQ